jgi:hypothetical protein
MIDAAKTLPGLTRLRGEGPGIHQKQKASSKRMDCRVKPTAVRLKI